MLACPGELQNTCAKGLSLVATRQQLVYWCGILLTLLLVALQLMFDYMNDIH
jgi:hypothetical protein